MKKILALLLTAFTLAQISLEASCDYTNFDALTLTSQIQECKETKRFRTQLLFDALAKAKVRKCRHFKHLQFYQGEARGTVGVYSHPCYDETYSLSLGYINTFFDWQHNPFFNQTHFNTLSARVGVITRRVENWLWIAELAFNFDIDHFSDFDDYFNWDFLAWGRYAFCDNLGVHVGFLGYTGMKIDRVYPIVGVDYRYNSRWKFNAIFPINFSVVYNFTPRWSVALASRVFDVRHRVNKHSHLQKGLWAYRTTGAELALNYDYDSWVYFNVHIGSTFGGRFKISNRHNNHGRRFRLDPTGYIGAQCNVRF